MHYPGAPLALAMGETSESPSKKAPTAGSTPTRTAGSLNVTATCSPSSLPPTTVCSSDTPRSSSVNTPAGSPYPVNKYQPFPSGSVHSCSPVAAAANTSAFSPHDKTRSGDKKIPPILIVEKPLPLSLFHSVKEVLVVNVQEILGLLAFLAMVAYFDPSVAKSFIFPIVLYHILLL